MDKILRNQLFRMFVSGFVATLVAIIVRRYAESWLAGFIVGVPVALLLTGIKETAEACTFVFRRACDRLEDSFSWWPKRDPNKPPINWKKVKKDALEITFATLNMVLVGLSFFIVGSLLERNFPTSTSSVADYAFWAAFLGIFGLLALVCSIESLAKRTGDAHSRFFISRLFHYRLGLRLDEEKKSDQKKEAATEWKSSGFTNEVSFMLAFSIAMFILPFVACAAFIVFIAVIVLDSLLTLLWLLASTKGLSIALGTVVGLTADWAYSPLWKSMWLDLACMVGWSAVGSLCGICLWRLKVWVDGFDMYKVYRTKVAAV